MKNYFIVILTAMAFTMSNAMEQRYQNQDGQNEPTRHYTLADLHQSSTAPRNIQQQHSNIDRAHLAIFGLQQGYTTNDLLDRYNSLGHFTSEQAHERSEAFTALYPHARREQQEAQQQNDTTFFNPSSYNYQNYYTRLPEPSNAMEVDEEQDDVDFLAEIGNSFSQNPGNHLFDNVRPHRPNDAVVSGNDLDQRLGQEIEDIVRDYTTVRSLGYPNYNGIPLNVWLSTGPSMLLTLNQQQTSQTVQSNSDTPDQQRVVASHDAEHNTYIVDTPMVRYERTLLGGLRKRSRIFRRTLRTTSINRHRPDDMQDDNDSDNDDNNTDNNDGSGATGTGNQ
jgi:hypothetical protein